MKVPISAERLASHEKRLLQKVDSESESFSDEEINYDNSTHSGSR